MGYEVQRVAVVELGPDPGSLTDYTCDVSEFVITEGRTTFTKSPSFGSPNVEQRAAATTAQVTMRFASNPGDATGVLAELRAAQATTSAELYFRVRYGSGAVSSSNPNHTGYITITDVSTGVHVSQVRRATATFPARAIAVSGS